jgi:hypothetical protein
VIREGEGEERKEMAGLLSKSCTLATTTRKLSQLMPISVSLDG